MSDQNGGVLAELRSWAGRTARSLQQRARDRLRDHLEQRLEQFRDELADPDNIDALQDSLRRMATWTYRLGFSVDPGAERLFDFVDWAESRHGRAFVIETIHAHNPMTSAEFVDLFEALLDSASGGPDGRAVEAFADVGRDRLIALLADLAAGPDGSPPAEDAAPIERVEYFESAGLPGRFSSLARRALRTADAPDTGETEAAEPPADSSEPSSSSSALSRSLRAVISAGESPLARTVDRLMDERTRFVTLSFVTALQAYLTRTAIDALPEMAAAAEPTPEDVDVIDL